MRRIIVSCLAAAAAALASDRAAFAQHLPGPFLSSCAGKSAGQACAVDNRREPFAGVCTAVTGGDGLACLPAACAQCGDGFVTPEAGEQCDPGSARETAACNLNCTVSVCGDGIVNRAAGEQCDPGTVGVPSSTCNANCTASRCGDGIVNPAAGEGCDDGGESRACTAFCTVTACGDGIVNRTAGEECDDGPGGSATCNANCTFRR